MHQEQFSVQLENFDGPFDLLISLIQKKELDITKVALSEVTREFIEYIKYKKDLDLTISSNFIVVAASLLNLKASQLLNYNEHNAEMTADYDLLLSSLVQISAFRKLGKQFAMQIAINELSFPRIYTIKRIKNTPSIDISKSEFLALMSQFDNEIKTPEQHLTIENISIDEETKKIENVLKKHKQLSFETLVTDVAGKIDYIVVRFLAILELFKKNKVDFIQKKSFADLEILYCSK
jgi:segregation and condensation protein A